MLSCCTVLALVVPALADADADELARKIATNAGDPYALSSLEFTFVVTAGEDEKVRRSHSWQPQAGRLTVHMGGEAVSFEGLGTTDPTAFVADAKAHEADWAKVCPGTPPERAAQAWSVFINDSYWLLAPSKLMDPGAQRNLNEDGLLEMSFDKVGLTPGDRYLLTVDADTSEVVAWSFVLQNGRQGSFAWTDHQATGPLTVSMHRATEAGDFVVQFEDVRATP
jgi:hypothetical protein